MKKLMIFASMLALMFAVTACAGDDDSKAADKQDTTMTEQKGKTTTVKSDKGEPGETADGDMEWNENESGLKWMDLKVGEGKAAEIGDNVECHYHVWLSDKDGVKGKSVQDSHEANPRTGQVETFKFKLGDSNLIKGWNEGMVGMKPGGARRLLVPPELGWGNRAMGNMIPANSTVLFEIELISYPGK